MLPSRQELSNLFGILYDAADNSSLWATFTEKLTRSTKATSATTTGSTAYPAWNLSWGYDRYGNRLYQTLNSGPGYQGSVQVTASTNRINCIGSSGQSCTGGVVPTYDANGNMTYDGSNTLVYDAENHAISATNQSASGTYTYDGNGLRVQKVSGGATTVYVYSGSKVIAEGDGVGSVLREYIYAGSSLVAKIGGSGISNGGFEQGLTGWSVGGSSATVISDATRAHSGSNYTQLSASANGGVDIVTPYVAVKPGDQVTFGGWVYLESGSAGGLGWSIVVADANHNAITFPGTANPSSSGSWGGLNGSMQHSGRTPLALKTKAKSLGRVRSAGTPPGLGFDQMRSNRSVLLGKHCRINALYGVASTV